MPLDPVLHMGFVIWDLETHDDHARLLCKEVDAVVVSVGYRLAPETPFGGGYDDCLAAYRWVVEHAADLGGDVSRTAVAGDSAGGNLARGEAYATALEAAGVPVVHRRYAGLIHGVFDLGPVSTACAAAVTELCADLKDLLRQP